MKAIRAEVRGVVQGVNFRYATQRMAQRLGLVGWVRNLPVGSVDVWAQGPAEAIEQLREFLAVGPRAAAVASADVEEVEPDPDLTGFRIRY